ncbi:DUF4396 domain-containing protein [Rhodobacteraceae bacterium]|nr:DUF4396 domain-containing protein [Paracoccaceae bacterium]
MIPPWFTYLSWISLAFGAVTALVLIRDLRARPPHMAIMAWVWPICALFGHVIVAWFYFKHARAPAHPHHHTHNHHDMAHDQGSGATVVSVAKGSLHCGAGCTLGDIIAESLVIAFPLILLPLGYPGFWGDQIFAIWMLDFILAFAIGVVFQYFAIKPMRDLSVGQAIKSAIKADAASLSAWQLGMYGVMAVFHFGLFSHHWGITVTATRPEFWFAMQCAMGAGFVTAYPVNWLLISRGIKEAM